MKNMGRFKIAISLLGLPGCGKGTQARLLSKEKKLLIISTGDLVKRTCFKIKAKKEREFCQKVRALYLKGIPQSKENIEIRSKICHL